jgi:hypothetical protein
MKSKGRIVITIEEPLIDRVWAEIEALVNAIAREGGNSEVKASERGK